MKVKQVVPSLTENSNALPSHVNPKTGLSNKDPIANIEMIIDDIFEISKGIDVAIDQMAQAARAGKDPWGTQGSLQKVKSDLMDIYKFVTGTAE